MTRLLEQAVNEIAKLPEDLQNAISSRLLEELKDEQAWTLRFDETSENQSDRMAAKVQKEIAEGRILPLGDTIRTLSIES